MLKKTDLLGAEITLPHWISLKAGLPTARLSVQPQDFPFITNIHGHNDEKLTQLIVKDPNGFPWSEALVT